MKTVCRIIALLLVFSMMLVGCAESPKGTSTPVSTTTQVPPSVPGTTQSVSSEPSVPTTQPTDPSVPATQPTDPSVPATQPTDPSVPATQPTDPSVPATQPTDPSVPATQPTEPSVPATQPTDPSIPVTEPTNPDLGGDVIVESIVLSAPKTTIYVGEELLISAVVFPDNAAVQTVIFEASGGTITDNGVFTAAEPGTYVITAYAMDDSGVTGIITVTVNPALVSSITISGGKSVTVGDSLQLKATVSPDYAGDPSITWSIISGSEFATIDQNGLLTAIAPGKVTVQVAANDGSGVKATHKVEVKPIQVSKITIHGESTVKVGKTVQLSVTVTPDNAADKTVKWSISKGSKYATIDENGLLTAIAAGSVTVKVTANDGSGISATFKITIEEAPMWDGSGTKDDPFLIRCLEDLLNLKNVLNKSGYYFKQVADIDCASVAWNPIGSAEKPFKHHFDGGNYTISNLYFQRAEDGATEYGLFAKVENASFKNIHIKNAVLTQDVLTGVDGNGDSFNYGATVGALSAVAYNCTFENCTASVDFYGFSQVGGLLGSLQFASNQKVVMNNCHTSGTIRGCQAGGLVGHIFAQEDYYSSGEEPNASIKNCSSSVDIAEAQGGYVGGLIGEMEYISVYNCHATGDVTSTGRFLGGLIGHAQWKGEVAYCYATGKVSATSKEQYGFAHAGGLIGYMNSYVSVHDCYATGDVHSVAIWSDCQDYPSMDGGIWLNYRNPCGSLIGTLDAGFGPRYGYKINVYNCYATGYVYADKICESEKTYCHGALIGFVFDDSTRRFMIDSSKADQSDWAGFYDSSVGIFGNNYNLENLRTYYTPMDEFLRYYGAKHDAMPTWEYVEIIHQDALKNKANFEGWDFENVWIMGDNGPELRENAKAVSVSEIPGPTVTPAAAKACFFEKMHMVL